MDIAVETITPAQFHEQARQWEHWTSELLLACGPRAAESRSRLFLCPLADSPEYRECPRLRAEDKQLEISILRRLEVSPVRQPDNYSTKESTNHLRYNVG
jgi:hypothetical protein